MKNHRPFSNSRQLTIPSKLKEVKQECWDRDYVFKLDSHESEVAFREKSEAGRTTTSSDIIFSQQDAADFVNAVIAQLGEL